MDIADLLRQHLANEAFLTASGRTPRCIPFADLADAPGSGLTPEQYAHASHCKACLHSLVLSFEEQFPSNAVALLLSGSAAAAPHESPLATVANAAGENATARREQVP